MSLKKVLSWFLSHFASRGTILLFHMCFGIRISSLFHPATQMIPIQNLNCPKNAKNDARTWFYKRVFCKYGGSSMKMESSSMNMECSSKNVESILYPMSAIFIKCLLWKNNVLGSEVIKCMNILGSIDFSFPISEPWLLSSPRRREISSCLSMSSGSRFLNQTCSILLSVMNHIHLYHLPTFGWINCQHTDCATALLTSKTT